MSTPQSPQPGDARPGREAETLHLADTPGYPLARSVEMPGALGYPTGSLSFRLGALRLRAEGQPQALAEETRGGTRRITHRIPALVLTGRYALDARPDEIRAIDTAGNLRPLSAEARQPTLPAGARAVPVSHPDDETVGKWTRRADAHRTKLMKTENGREMLRQYGTHNESYYDIFNGSSTASRNLRDLWAENGITQRMSQHTYDTTDPDEAAGAPPSAGEQQQQQQQQQQPVNDWQDPKEGGTYNGHAWQRRLVVQTALATEAARYRRKGDQKTADRLIAAAKAAEGFSKSVQLDTGNDDSRTIPMTQDDVYTTIDQHSGELPAVSDAEMARYNGLATFTDGEVQAPQAEQEDQPEEPEDWITLSDEDRAIIRKFGSAAYHDLAQQGPPATDTLHTGDCTARLEDVRITTRLAPGGAPADVTVELPDLALGIDDEEWRGSAADVARERLAAMRFVHTLLQDAIAETVRHAAFTGIAGYAHPQDGRS
ncbi:hypothetical protein FGW37_01550 [Streptomyces rectiverticillatus]|uniref:hypothetical protein n=1 Tax=Streptomyces rectiverticillatus TaxID=173860 RepID=UPI0015C3D6D5|nr:hypothetical protein [Streptomyces rectiverticillatus]QLE70466.1 hypothetical protein FGW37_01550 [Streptomyces rectiverticillatus]